jgi:ABC-type multidrug transport system fused ATPase/permease subunit
MRYVSCKYPTDHWNADIYAAVDPSLLEMAGHRPHDLRQRVYAHLQRLSMASHDRQQAGPLISTITDDINAVQEFASNL